MEATTATNQIVNDQESKVYRKVMWRIMPLTIIAYLVTYFDRINISFAKTQMQAEIGLNDATYGLAASMFFIGYVLFEVPSAWGLQKYGAIKWLSRTLITLGIATAAMMFAYDKYTLYFMRFLIGAMEAGFGPAIFFYLYCWFPKRYLARVNGLWFLSIPLAGAIGAPIAGLILKNFNGVMGLAAWHWLFIMSGIPCIILGIIFFIKLFDKPSQATWLSEEEKSIVQSNLDNDTAKIKNTNASHIWKVLFTKDVLLFSIIYFSVKSSAYGLNFWMPQIIEKSGVKDVVTVGFLTSLPYIVACIGMLVITNISDRTAKRKSYLLGCLIATIIGYCIVCLIQSNTIIMMIGMIIATAGSFIAIPIFWTIPQSNFNGIAVASGTAAINSLGQLSGMITPALIGVITQMTGSNQIGMLIVVPLLVISCLFTLLNVKEPERHS